jgi:HAD superfamily hydrolase (TIGR01484 family)
MKSPRLILIDIDGCLKPPAPAPIDLDVLRALRSFNRECPPTLEQDSCCAISLVSGRAQGEIGILLELIESPVPGICENGVALVFPHGEIVDIDPLVTAESLEGLSHIKRHHLNYLLEKRLIRLKAGREWSITICPLDLEDLSKVEEICTGIISKYNYPLHCLVSRRCVDILPQGVDKGTALHRLASYLNIPVSDIGGIGDSRGDLALLKQAGFSACPQNAHPCVKHVVDYVSQRKFSDGVLEILSFWLENRYDIKNKYLVS